MSSDAQRLSNRYDDDYLPVEGTMTAQTSDAQYWKQMDDSLSNSLNNVFKHHLPINQHADGRCIISDSNKTHILVLYAIDFLCAKTFDVQKKNSSNQSDQDGDASRPRRRKRKRYRRADQEQVDLYVPITARIPGILVDTQLPPRIDEDGIVLLDTIKLITSEEPYCVECVCWTCEQGYLDALALTHPQNFQFMRTQISKGECFAIEFTQTERRCIRRMGMDANKLVKAISPFTEAELQSEIFVQFASQKQRVLDSVLSVPSNDEDETLLLGQITMRGESEDAVDECLLFLSFIKGYSLIHINVKNAVSATVCEDEVASSDVTRLVPASFRDRISQVMFIFRLASTVSGCAGCCFHSDFICASRVPERRTLQSHQSPDVPRGAQLCHVRPLQHVLLVQQASKHTLSEHAAPVMAPHTQARRRHHHGIAHRIHSEHAHRRASESRAVACAEQSHLDRR